MLSRILDPSNRRLYPSGGVERLFDRAIGQAAPVVGDAGRGSSPASTEAPRCEKEVRAANVGYTCGKMISLR
jgi:hypothetical protein